MVSGIRREFAMLPVEGQRCDTITEAHFLIKYAVAIKAARQLLKAPSTGFESRVLPAPPNLMVRYR